MRAVCLVVGHVGSGSSDLYASLCRHPWVAGRRQRDRVYASAADLLALAASPGRVTHAGGVQLDELLYNHQLQTKAAYSLCKFIYVVRRPRHALPLVGYGPEQSVAYYLFRLRRMCEMAKRSGGLLVPWDSLGRCGAAVGRYLGLRDVPDCPVSLPRDAPEPPVAAEAGYEAYFSFLSRHLEVV